MDYKKQIDELIDIANESGIHIEYKNGSLVSWYNGKKVEFWEFKKEKEIVAVLVGLINGFIETH